jgi:hypothetical protein
MNRRLALSVLAVGILFALIGTNMLISEAAIPENVSANPIDTLNAIKTNALGTATALHNKISGTVTAFRADLSGSATGLSGTLNSFKNGFSGTLTAFAPTLNAYRTNIPGTVTAFELTVTAIRPAIIGTATAFAGTVQAIKSTLALTPISSDVASQTIVNYAINTFGIPVTIVKAGGADANIVKTFPVPANVSFAQSLAANLATQIYVAQLSNGVAWLSTGAGTLTANTGTTADVQSSSLGIYTLSVPFSGTLNASSALALAKATYPVLAGYTYTASSESSGFAWYSHDSASVIDPATKHLIVTPQTVILSVIPGTNGTAAVSAAVGRGTYAVSLIQ